MDWAAENSFPLVLVEMVFFCSKMMCTSETAVPREITFCGLVSNLPHSSGNKNYIDQPDGSTRRKSV